MKHIVFLVSTILLSASASMAARVPDLLKHQPKGFFKTEEAVRVGHQVVAYQRVTGGWPKNINMSVPMTPQQLDSVKAEKWRRDDSTTDNGATNREMHFLAKLYQATGDTIWLEPFRRGVEYLLSGQYPGGGWPQFWPENHGYQIHITYNDNAMVNTLNMLRDISASVAPYTDMIDKATALRIDSAFAKGIECILATQIRDADGNLTVWCQQHDRETLLPAPARSYELPSYCSSESAGIVRLLISLPAPDARVREAVHGAMRWFDTHKLTGVRLERHYGDGGDTRLVSDPDEPLPLWARFYDLEKGEPYVCDRDGVPRKSLEEIGHERRNGYGWYNRAPLDLYPLYAEWCALYDPEHTPKP